MKLIIAGSRTFRDYALLEAALAEELPHVSEVITGGAPGADRLGSHWAWRHQLARRVFLAKWTRYGLSAGPRRNEEMAHAGDRLVAFWDGTSPGTKNMIACMRRLGKPVRVVDID